MVNQQSISIEGSPLRYSSEKYKNDYENNRDELLTTLATESCGSFLISADNGNEREFITAPGFRGTYLDTQSGKVSENLGGLLNEKDVLETNPTGMISYLGYEGRLPYSHATETPFKNVAHINGGKIIKINNDGNLSQRTFLDRARQASASSYGDAIETALSPLEGSEITLLFSGGKDSLSLYLALKRVVGEKNIEPVTINLNPTIPQGSEALELPEVNSTIIEPEGGWPTTDTDTFDYLLDEMESRFVNPTAPYHAVPDEYLRDYLIAGHNIDAMLCLDMPKAPQIFNYESIRRASGSSSYPMAIALPYYYINYLFTHILPNIHYWKQYADNDAFRRIYLQLIPDMVDILDRVTNGILSSPVGGLSSGAHTSSSQDVSAALLTKSLPSQVKPTEGLTKQDVLTELHDLQDWWEHSEFSVGEEMPLIRYYHYAQSMGVGMNKAGMANLQPATWGPLMPTFVTPIDWKDVIKPKYQVKEYIQNTSGESYEDMRSERGENLSKQWKQKDNYPFLQELKRRHKDGLCLHNHIDNSRVESKIDNIMEKVDSNDLNPDLDKKIIFEGHSLLNLDLLIQDRSSVV